ncbi:MAG: hypothetical protein KatS3mg016_0374 [Fimbriimonadales bacterium]|nr:MAG: hypothetical protein KatS3mg016_0374 [Fimbriimonadales bacterium]
MKVAAIVPAYNEATRIERVLGVLTQCPSLHEIIVVNDGSLDDTATVALQFAQHQATPNTPPVRVINLPVNRGKGGAMFAGATATDADVIIFFDADLIGLKPEHVERILKPVLEGEVAMSIGVFRGGRLSTDMAQILVPYISGQRALLRGVVHRNPGHRAHALRGGNRAHAPLSATPLSRRDGNGRGRYAHHERGKTRLGAGRVGTGENVRRNR